MTVISVSLIIRINLYLATSYKVSVTSADCLFRTQTVWSNCASTQAHLNILLRIDVVSSGGPVEYVYVSAHYMHLNKMRIKPLSLFVLIVVVFIENLILNNSYPKHDNDTEILTV